VKRLINGLIYCSVALGALLLAQLLYLAPRWLFMSVAAGWAAYLVAALLAFKGSRLAYPLTLALSALALLASLGNPVHWAYVRYGEALPAFTFLAGDAVQLALLFLIPLYLLRRSGGNR